MHGLTNPTPFTQFRGPVGGRGDMWVSGETDSVRSFYSVQRELTHTITTE